MHILLATVLLNVFSLSAANAEGPSAYVTLASDYNWRGISFNSKSGAAVQSDISYATDFGLTAGMWAGNIAFPADYFGGYEFDPYISYAHSFGDIQAYVTFMYYTFAQNAQANSTETVLGMKWKDLNVYVTSIPKYFSFETAYIYYNINYAFQIHEKLWLAPAYGFADFDKELVGFYGDYTHYKIGLQYRKDNYNLEMYFSDTDRQLNTTTTTQDNIKDQASVVSLTINL